MRAEPAKREERKPAVSVVVPVFNAVATVGRTLSALRAQTVGSDDFEVLVVDGNSTDGTLELLAAAQPDIRVLHNPQREPASGRNLGVSHARADVIAFTDADCEPDPGWLAGGLQAVARTAIVQGRVMPQGPQGPFDRSLAVTSEYGLYETANLFVRREVFDEVGGFEPVPGLSLDDGSHFGEDVWFVWRAKRLGFTTAFADAAVVRHAVVRRGIAAALSETNRRRYFPHLVRLVPELRQAFLHRRWFLSPRTMRFDAALAGIALTIAGFEPALLLAAPYCRECLEEALAQPPRSRLRVLAGRLADDGVGFASLVSGSLSASTLVI